MARKSVTDKTYQLAACVMELCDILSATVSALVGAVPPDLESRLTVVRELAYQTVEAKDRAAFFEESISGNPQ